MKNLARFSGGLGLIFILFGLISLLFGASVFRGIAFAQLGLGVIGIVLYVVYYLGDLISVILRKREAIFGVFGGVILLAILVGLNVIAHSKFGSKTFDTTANRVFTLAPESQEIAKGLTDPIRIVGFFEAGARQTDVLKNLIEKYTPYTDKISLEIIDPDEQPALLKEFEADRGNVMVRNETTKSVVKLVVASEEALTNALKRALRSEVKSIYFIQGHNEASLDDPQDTFGANLLKLFLENEGFKVHGLKLAETRKIPQDASLVVLWGARRTVAEMETEILKNYLSKGGALIIGQNPMVAKDRFLSTGYESLLQTYGLQFKPSVLLETYGVQGRQGSITLQQIFTTKFGTHPIVSKISGQASAAFKLAQGVIAAPSYKGPAKVSLLVESSDKAWAETNFKSLTGQASATRDPGDLSGPIPIGQISEWPVEKPSEGDWSKNGRLIVFGDATFASDGDINNQNNRDLFMNSVAYIIGDRAASLTIKARTWKSSTLNLTNDQKLGAVYASVFVIPQALLILALLMWLFRRNRV